MFIVQDGVDCGTRHTYSKIPPGAVVTNGAEHLGQAEIQNPREPAADIIVEEGKIQGYDYALQRTTLNA